MSATDPVAVVALMDDVGAPKWLKTIQEGESMLNDGTAFVLFEFFLKLAENHHFSGGEVVAFFIRLPVVGVLFGYGAGELVHAWISMIHCDPYVEILITILGSYLVFLIGQFALNASGILAVVTMGTVLSRRTKPLLAGEVKLSLEHVWGTISYAANTVVFILSGEIIGNSMLSNKELLNYSDLGFGLLLYVLVIVIRAIGNLILYYPLRSSGYGMSLPALSILTWGGLRGAVGG